MAGKPELGNSKIRVMQPIGVEQHVQASVWTNIADDSLREALLNYFRQSGEKPNCKLRVRTGQYPNYQYIDCASFNLFVNDENQPTGAAAVVTPEPQAPAETGGLYAKVSNS